MPQTVDTPIGQIEFPDGMPPEEMQKALDVYVPQVMQQQKDTLRSGPGFMGQKLQQFRQSLDPLIGRPQERVTGEARSLDNLGLLGAAFTPDPNYPLQLPQMGQQKGVLPQIGAAMYNPLADVVNSVGATPGGLLTMGVGSGAQKLAGEALPEVTELVRNASRVLLGLFAGTTGAAVPGEIKQEVKNLKDPDATLQTKIQGGVSPVLSSLFAGHLGKTAIEGETTPATKIAGAVDKQTKPGLLASIMEKVVPGYAETQRKIDELNAGSSPEARALNAKLNSPIIKFPLVHPGQREGINKEGTKPASTLGGTQENLPPDAKAQSVKNNSRAAWGDFGGLNKPQTTSEATPAEGARTSYSRTEPKGSFPHEPVIEAWKKQAGPNAPAVEVVNDPKWVQGEYGVQGEAQGGKIKVNLAHIKDPTELARVLREEHYHILLDTEPGRKVISDALAKNLGEKERADLAERYGKLSDEQSMNEFLAQSASEQKSGWRKAVEDVKIWLGQKGLLQLNDREVAKAMVKTLRKTVSNVGDKSSPAPPISKQEQEELLKDAGMRSLTKDRLFATTTEKELDKEKPFGIQMAKDGTLPTETLRGKMAQQVGQGEVQALEEAGFGEWLKGKGGRVTGEEVKKWVRENGPRVEVRKFGEGQTKQNSKVLEMNDLQHFVETSLSPDVQYDLRTGSRRALLNDRWYSTLKDQKGEDVANKVRRYVELSNDPEAVPVASNNAHWSFVAPKAEKDMPGYTEIAVVKPLKDRIDERGVNVGNNASIKFPESHSFPPNTLAFARGYMETLPNGKKVWHVVEVQSDWAAHQKNLESPESDYGPNMISVNRRLQIMRSRDPLLSHYESLALKASIQHAISEGADAIAVSDAETAMMSEGHDRVAGLIRERSANDINSRIGEVTMAEAFGEDWERGKYYIVGGQSDAAGTYRIDEPSKNNPNFASPEIAKELVSYKPGDTFAQVPQAPGMRQHYDLSLPNILKKLTGKEGERVEFGTHEKAISHDVRSPEEFNRALDVTGGLTEEQLNEHLTGSVTPRKNLIFRNPDGTPKTSVSARIFPLDSLKSRIQKGEPASMYRTAYSLTKDPIGLKTFAEQDVAPHVKKGVDALKASKDLIIGMFSPTSLARTKDLDVMFEAKGYKEEFLTKIHAAVSQMRDSFDKMPKQEQLAFIDKYKNGIPQSTPALQAAADLFRKWDGELFQEMDKYSPGVPFKENHLRVLWKVIPGSVKKPGQDYSGFRLGNRPLRGSRGFLKQSTLGDMSEGLMKGGVPVSYNPFEMQLLNAQDIMKFVSANRAWEGLKKTGAVVFVRKGKDVPPGYTRINDTISKVYFPTDKGMVQTGEYFVEQGTAKLINNYLGTDFVREGTTGKIGRPLMDIKNASTYAELAMSPFHAFFVSGETMGSSVGLGLQKLTTEGKRVEGVKDIADAVVSPVTTYKLGAKLERYAKSGNLSEFQKQNPDDYTFFAKHYPSFTSLLNDAYDGGAKIGLHEDYKTSFGRGMQKAITDGNWPGVALRAAPWLLDKAFTGPLFDKYIPRLKLGMFLREYSFELERHAGDLTSGTMTRGELARKTWNFIDDRFGEMNYDNLYWKRTFKSSLQLATRSVTWKMGDVRGFGKAGRDVGKMLIAPLKGEKPEVTAPVGWLMGMAITTGVMSSLVTRGATGKWPWELEGSLEKNLTFPRIDAKDETQRVSLPTYWKDLVHMKHDPVGFIKSSETGEIDRVIESWENKDFYNVEIGGAVDRFKHLLPEPISVSAYEGAKNSGKSDTLAKSGLVGFPAAPAYVTDSDALQEAKKIRGSMAPQKVITKDKGEQRKSEKEAVGEIKSGVETLQDAMQKGQVLGTRQKAVQKKVDDTPLQYLVDGMGIEDSMKVFAKGTSKEKEELRDEIKRKIYRSSTLEWEKRTALLEYLDQPVEKEKPSIFGGFNE